MKSKTRDDKETTSTCLKTQKQFKVMTQCSKVRFQQDDFPKWPSKENIMYANLIRVWMQLNFFSRRFPICQDLVVSR